MKKLIWIVFLAAFAVADLSAAEYYVDPVNGADTNDGSASSPWKTLAHAVATAQADDVLTLKKGTHTITATLTIDKALEIRGEGDKEETIITSNNKAYKFLISTDGTFVHSLTFANFSGAYLEKAVSLSSDSVVSNVVIRGFSANKYCVDISKGLLTSSYITNNTAKVCIAYFNKYGIVENCLLKGNKNTNSSASNAGVIHIIGNGMTMRNCTVVDNVLAGTSHAVYIPWDGTGNPKIYNSLIANNLSTTGETRNFSVRDKSSSYTVYVVCNCIYPGPEFSIKGKDNFFIDPKLDADGYHILQDSPCNGGATNGVDNAGVQYASSYDINGMPRGDKPSIGAFEYIKKQEMVIVPKYSSQLVHQPDNLKLWCDIDGTYTEPLKYEWDNDGDGDFELESITNVFSNVGVYGNIAVRVTDGAGAVKEHVYEEIFVVHEEGAKTYYVDCVVGDDSADGSRQTPWKTIGQALSDLRVADGDGIVLSPGRHIWDISAKVDKALDIHGERSDNSSTVLAVTNTVGSFVLQKDGARLRDFTVISEGVATGSALLNVQSASLVSNVVFTGSFESTPNISSGSKNIVYMLAGTLSGCFITNNCANYCIVTPSEVLKKVRIENCAVVGNRCKRIFDIQSSNVDMRNCTFSGNVVADTVCLFSRFGTYSNNIIWDNVDSNGVALPPKSERETWYRNLLQGYESIPTDRIKGECFAANPKFRNGKCLSFYSDSPCIDAGDNSHAPQSSVDILGNPRIFKKTIDLGCVEVQIMPGFYIRVR